MRVGCAGIYGVLVALVVASVGLRELEAVFWGCLAYFRLSDEYLLSLLSQNDRHPPGNSQFAQTGSSNAADRVVSINAVSFPSSDIL